MRETGRNYLHAVLASSLVLMSACTATSPPVTFYTLGTDSSVRHPGAEGTVCSDKGIGIGPVNWPRYLDQPQIVTRRGPNKLYFDEFHRWGGSLQDDFKQVLKRNLSGLLQSSKVADSRLTRRFSPVFRVELDIRQFEGQLGGEVVLDVGWIIVLEKGGTVRVYDSIITKPVSGPGYEALVHASSMAVADLSGDIAAEFLKICSTVK